MREAHTAQQLWKPARSLDSQMKEVLAEELRDLGWSVCQCDGEADVCIAGQQGPITVATTDSDFLFLGVDTILRQDPQDRSSFREFSIQDILESLDIEQEAWTAVGVVTKNDYCQNIPEHGISTNFKAIQPISMAGMSDPKGILDEYCSQVSEKTKKSYNRSMFQLAYDVFFDHHEDLEENPTAPGFFDYTIMDMLTAVENVLQRYKRSRRPPKTVSSTLGMVDAGAHTTDTQENPPDGTQDNPSDGTQDAMQVDSSGSTQEDAPDNVQGDSAGTQDSSGDIQVDFDSTLKDDSDGIHESDSDSTQEDDSDQEEDSDQEKDSEQQEDSDQQEVSDQEEDSDQEDDSSDSEEDGSDQEDGPDDSLDDDSDSTQDGTTDGSQDDTSTSTTGPRPTRAHKRLMPSNIYKAKPYTKTTETAPESTVAPRKKVAKKKKEKKAPKAALAPCSRENRKDLITNKAPSRTNKRNPMTVVQDKLSAKYMTIAMDCGTLSRRVKEGLETNFVDLDTEERGVVAKAIVSTIREMVYIGTETTRMIFQAIACYEAKVMTEYPATEAEDSNKRKEAFRQFDFLENNAFFANLMSDLFFWHDQSRRQGRPKGDTPANRCVSEIIAHYRTVLETAGKTVPPLKRQLTGGLGTFFQLAGQRMADVVQSHYRKHNLELLSRVKQFNEGWYFGEGSSIIDSVDKVKGTSDTYGQVTLFWLLNSRLPQERQLAYFPESDFTDQNFVITERALLEALLSGRSKDDIVKETLGGLLDDLSDHPGDLAFKLFLSKQVVYAKTVCVVNPTIPADADFEQRGIQPLLGQTESEFEDQVSIMENASDAKDAKAVFKTYLDAHLEGPDEYKAMIGSNNPDIAHRRNVLSGSISTNGHELKVLAYSITRPKPKPRSPRLPQGKINKTQSKLPDVKEVLVTPDMVESQDLNPDAYVVVGIDPGVHKTATATMVTSAQPDTHWNLSISQGSQCVTTKRYLKGLEQAKKKSKHTMPSGQEKNVCELESTIQPVEPQQANGSDLLPVWQSLRASIERHVISIMQVEEPLRKFYSSMMFKIKGHELKQAKTATSSKGIDRLLAKAEDLKQEAGAARTLVVVGDGSFTAHKGPTLHQKFISDLKTKVRL